MSRLFLAAGALALSSLPALAGGFGCVGDCYTPTYVPPTYGSVTEKVMTRAPQTYAITTPAQYRTVYDTVQTGGGRYWSVTRDPYTGRLVGCWITKPVTYARIARTVMVSPPQVVPYAVPAQYGYRTQIVQTSPGYKAWSRVSQPVSYGGSGYDIDGAGYGGYGSSAGRYGGGFGGAYGYGFRGGYGYRAGYGYHRGYGGTPRYFPRHAGGYGGNQGGFGGKGSRH